MSLKEIHTEAKRIIKNNFWKLFFIVLLNYLIVLAFTKVSDSFDTSVFTLIFAIVSYIITVPLSYGVIVSFMKSSREESISVFDFISDGMKAFKRVWCVFGRTILKLVLPIIIFIIGFAVSFGLLAKGIYDSFAGQGTSSSALLIASAVILIATAIYYIVKAISYSLTNYILYDNPELSAKEIVEESSIMMKGHVWSYILLMIYTIILYLVLMGACSLIMTLLQSVSGVILGMLLMIAGAVILLPYSLGLQIAFYNLLKGTDKTENKE